MPNGLKKYMELELFPRIQVKAGKGISLHTACRWLHKEGLKYTAHTKKPFIMMAMSMKMWCSTVKKSSSQGCESQSLNWLNFKVEDIDKEVEQEFPDRVKLVLVAHGEMTAQAHDGEKMSWVWQGEQPLKKKGAGRGLHQSDFICSLPSLFNFFLLKS